MQRILTCSVFAVALLIPVIGQSQQTPEQENFRYGIVGGAALNDIESGTESFDAASGDMVGFSAGIQGAWQIASTMFKLKPELVFARRGWDTNGNAFGQNINANYNFSYLELPLLLSASAEVADGIRPKLMAGPHGALFLDGSQDAGDDPFSAGGEIDGNQVNDLQFGVTGAVGANFDVGNLTLTSDVRYQRNMTGVFDQDATGPDNADSVEHESWQLTLGFLF